MYLAYKITNIENGKYYLGVHKGIPGDEYPGSGIALRLSYSKRLGKNWTPTMVWESGIYSKEICKYFDNEIDMYDWESENVTEREVKDEMCYNMTLGGHGGLVFSQNKETRNQKISEACKGHQNHLGHNHTEEAKRKMSEAHKGEKNHFYGKHFSEEHKRKISESNKDKKISEEQKRKLREARKGKKHSEETLRKMSESQKGKKISEEHKRKISESLKGHKVTEESRRKMSEWQKGKTLPKFKWLDSDGNIHIMDKGNAIKIILIGF